MAKSQILCRPYKIMDDIHTTVMVTITKRLTVELTFYSKALLWLNV